VPASQAEGRRRPAPAPLRVVRGWDAVRRGVKNGYGGRRLGSWKAVGDGEGRELEWVGRAWEKAASANESEDPPGRSWHVRPVTEGAYEAAARLVYCLGLSDGCEISSR
jgi:hypothetical protein